jgi:hypothetical protein
LVYSYIGIRVTRIGGFLIRVNWNLGLLDGCRTARVRLVREIAERETGVARDGFRDSSRVLRRRHHLRREVLRQLRDAGERECVEEFEGRDVVQPDHASRFSEEPHSSRDGHQRILVVDKWTLARDVTEIAEVPCHQSLITIGSEKLLPLHFRSTHSGVVLHEEADASRDAQPQLQRPIIQLVGEWNLVAKSMDMRPGPRIDPVHSL